VEHLFLGWIYFVPGAQEFLYQQQLWATTGEGNIITAWPVGRETVLEDFFTVGGRTGIMGLHGMVETLLLGPASSIFPFRAYLHYIYNSVVVIPTVIAFVLQSRRVYDKYLAKALPELSEDQLVEATPKLERVQYAAGTVVINQDDPADRFYIITRGQAEVVRTAPDGQEILVTRLGTGQYFGEIGLLHGGRRVASVRAATDLEVLALARTDFADLMHESDISKQELDRLVRQRVGQLKALQRVG
jgi:hypothetical protein